MNRNSPEDLNRETCRSNSSNHHLQSPKLKSTVQIFHCIKG